MSYTILNRKEFITIHEEVLDEEGNVIIPPREEKTVNTLVEYDFNGIKITVDIPHFMPQSENDIILGILNREITEKTKLEILSNN